MYSFFRTFWLFKVEKKSYPFCLHSEALYAETRAEFRSFSKGILRFCSAINKITKLLTREFIRTRLIWLSFPYKFSLFPPHLSLKSTDIRSFHIVSTAFRTSVEPRNTNRTRANKTMVCFPKAYLCNLFLLASSFLYIIIKSSIKPTLKRMQKTDL